MHVFEAAEIQIRQQILNPCLLLDSSLRRLRDYEIKLDRGFSTEKTFCSSFYLQISLWAAASERALIFLRMLLKIDWTRNPQNSSEFQMTVLDLARF
jgi:hypothetical protein